MTEKAYVYSNPYSKSFYDAIERKTSLTGGDAETLAKVEQPSRGPKESAGKRHWEWFPFREAGHVVDVFEYGVKKYGAPFTYRAGIPAEELLAAIIRHAIKMLDGNNRDDESGCLHAAHIAADALMILAKEKK